jgi:hypothetical protein
MSLMPVVTVPSETGGAWDPAKTFAKAFAALAVFFRAAADVAIWLLVFGWIPLVALALVIAATRLRRPRITAS